MLYATKFSSVLYDFCIDWFNPQEEPGVNVKLIAKVSLYAGREN